MVTLNWVPPACLFCPLPELKGHLSRNTQIKLGIIFQVKFNPCFSPEINVGCIASFCIWSGQLWHANFFPYHFVVILLFCRTCTKQSTFINLLTPTSDQDRISPYNINTISNRQVMRIKKKYQLEDYKLIQYQILKTNMIRIVSQTVRRITNEIPVGNRL